PVASVTLLQFAVKLLAVTLVAFKAVGAAGVGAAVGEGVGVGGTVAVAVAVGIAVGVGVGLPPSEAGSVSWKASCWEVTWMATRPYHHAERCWVSNEEP